MPFFPRDLGLLLIFPVVEVTVVLLSQGGLCTGLEKGWARAEPLQTLSEWPHVLSDLSCGSSAWFPATSPELLLCHGEEWLTGADELGDSCICFGVFCPISLVGLMHGPPHFSAVGGALRGLAGPGCSRQMGLRPWLGSKPYRYPPLYACTSGKGEGFTDAWPSLVLSPEDFTQVALTPH